MASAGPLEIAASLAAAGLRACQQAPDEPDARPALTVPGAEAGVDIGNDIHSALNLPRSAAESESANRGWPG
jgi:predicted outer membrane protein